jgi:hypothetical protein
MAVTSQVFKFNKDKKFNYSNFRVNKNFSSHIVLCIIDQAFLYAFAMKSVCLWF